ncbi:hypothetical protein JCM8097_004232 [Rhodosporidiobolus ruineniae]
MLLSALLPLSLLSTLARANSPSASTDLSTLESQYSSAVHQAAKAGRLLRRAKGYGSGAEAKHKRAVFKAREEKWEKEAASLKNELAVAKKKAAPTTTSRGAASKTTKASKSTSSSKPTSTSAAGFTTYIRASSAATPSSTSKKPSATAVELVSTPSASSSSSSSVAASSGSKKMICYNDAPLTKNLDVGFAYNWAATPGGELKDGVEFVPMLWSGNNPGDWATIAPQQIAAGAKYLLGFNEPDLPSQSNMTVAESVSAWKEYMSPLAKKAKLVSPAVTNGGAPMGVTYLQNFYGNCTACYDETHAIALHWYDSATNVAYFKKYLKDAHTAFPTKKIWLTEFAGSGSVADQQAFFEEVIRWMEKQDWLERYCDFIGTFVSDASGTLTDLGRTYSETE